MDGDILLEKYAKDKGINIFIYSDEEWEDMVNKFDDEMSNYLEACYHEGKFNNFLDELLEHKGD